MTAAEWAGFGVALMTLTAGFAGFTRWLVKQYLYELNRIFYHFHFDL